MTKPFPIASAHGVRCERPPLPFERIALLLQGGGALGAYQAGVYEALVEAGIHPDWVAGISIGAINAALIAGNPPDERVDKLRAFWEGITCDACGPWSTPMTSLFPVGDLGRKWLNQIQTSLTLWRGVPGFFAPRFPAPWLQPDGAVGATSFYDTAELRSMLERLIDFDRINSRQVRLSVGAVNVRSGNFVYFDTNTHRIGPAHVMASGALPPAFAAVEVDGEYYWDGGLVSNTPLRWVVDGRPQRDTLVFQVDLWPSRGELPHNMARVNTRQKEIMYSSRTRAASTRFMESQALRNSLADLLKRLPPDLANEPEVAMLRPFSERKDWNLIHLIYHAKGYEGDSKDYEFSRQSMVDHWRAGYDDTLHTLSHPEVLERPRSPEGVFIFDIAEHPRE